MTYEEALDAIAEAVVGIVGALAVIEATNPSPRITSLHHRAAALLRAAETELNLPPNRFGGTDKPPPP